MKLDNRKILTLLLYTGVIYYIIGAITHFFGITLFPWFDRSLYSPYHDILIAMASLTFAGFFYMAARSPEKNNDIITVIITASFICGILTLWMAYSIDFSNALYKKNQAIVEGILLLFLSLLLIVLKKKR